MNEFNLKDEKFFDHDLVARVMYPNDVGAVPYDTDLTYLVRQKGQHFSIRETVSEKEITDFLQSEEDIKVFFIRWEKPEEWSM